MHLPCVCRLIRHVKVGFNGMILWWVRMLNEFEVSGKQFAFIQLSIRLTSC